MLTLKWATWSKLPICVNMPNDYLYTSRLITGWNIYYNPRSQAFYCCWCRLWQVGRSFQGTAMLSSALQKGARHHFTEGWISAWASIRELLGTVRTVTAKGPSPPVIQIPNQSVKQTYNLLGCCILNGKGTFHTRHHLIVFLTTSLALRTLHAKTSLHLTVHKHMVIITWTTLPNNP